MNDDIRKLAANDYGWAEAQISVLRDNGMPAPPALPRLSALAKAVCDAPVTAGVQGIDPGEVVALAGRATRLETERDEARRLAVLALEDSARGLLDVAAQYKTLPLDGSMLGRLEAADATVANGTATAKPVLGGDGKPTGEFAHVVPGETDATFAKARAIIPLRHGLVLIRREGSKGATAVFSEVKEASFVYQWVGDAGMSDPVTADPAAWWNDAWIIGTTTIATLPRWNEKAQVLAPDAPKGTQGTLPGAGPAPGAEPKAPPAQVKVADWTPTSEKMAEYVTDISAKLVAAGKPMMIDVSLIRSLIGKFKAELLGKDPPKTELTNPGLSFHHWAVKNLKG